MLGERKRKMGTDAPLREIYNFARYPVEEPGSRGYDSLVAECRERLAEVGCCTLTGFLQPKSVQRIAGEAERLAPQAFRRQTSHNPYFSKARSDLPDGHPINRFQDRTNGFVCTDLISDSCDLWRFFLSDAVTAFLSDAFTINPLFRYADPLASMPFNTMRPGDAFPWHFDTNEFTVTLMIQPSESGGVFEYAPGIRDPEDEHYDDVEAVLSGDRSRIRTLELAPGDMQLFLGRYTLHRVTRVEGSRARHVAIPSWARNPGMVGQPYRTEQIYGRVLPIHRKRGSVREDALAD